MQADAGSVRGVEAMIDATVKRFGKIDILIPNAGILPMKDLKGTSEEDFDRCVRLNVKGPYFLVQVRQPPPPPRSLFQLSTPHLHCAVSPSVLHILKGRARPVQKALPHLSNTAKIIFLSTTLTQASTVMPSYLLYNTTKGAIEQMTRVLSKDLMRQGICVNAVAPGPTGTELFYEGKNEGMLKMIAGFSPANRIGTPEEVADVVAFLGAEGSRWVSGQVVRVNGGMA